MIDQQFKTWRAFRRFLDGYTSLSAERRGQFLFRGQSDAKWPLKTTLDVAVQFSSDEERNATIDRLLQEFRLEAIRVGFGSTHLPDGDALELLARHHGLPSPLLDWTASPFIAAYFAFEGVKRSNAKQVAVWGLDRSRWPEGQVPVQIIDDVELVRFNRRALQQRGVFLRISSIQQSVEEGLGSAITRFRIPASEARVALSELYEMTIDATHLFADLDAACRTVTWRVL